MPRRDARSARAKDEDDGATPRRKNLGTSENDEMQRTTRKRRERREKNDEKRTNGCENGCDTCFYAASNGHLECLKYARENGCPWDEKTCEGAAKYGHLECLKYAREQGCRWSKWTCYKAAENGHLECLKYAHEHGCPWDYWTCDKAAEKGHLECLKYACAHGFPGSDPYATALNEVCIPDADKRLGVEVALMFHRANGGDISMREFLPVWKEHGELYREAHLRVARELAPTL